MRALQPRQIDIMDVAKTEGRVDVEGLAARFQVTPQTIRRDLNELCELEMLHRVHGGAIYPSNTVNVAYPSRRHLATDGKRQIAEAVAALVPNNCSLILNIGTTTEQVAMALRNHDGLMVVTNNLNVAFTLSDAPGIEVVVTGGMVRKSDGGIVGAAAVDMVNQFKVDYAIIGASAIDEEGTVLDFDYREVRVTQAIMARARRTVLVADAMKFERRAPVRIADLAQMDIFVTDRPLSPEIAAICADAGVRVQIAQSEQDLQDGQSLQDAQNLPDG